MCQPKYRFAPALLDVGISLLRGLVKSAEREAGRLQTATYIDFALEVKVSNPVSYRYSMSEPSLESDLPEALDRSLSSFPRGEEFESRTEISNRESCSRKRCFRSVTDGIREELENCRTLSGV